MGACITQSIAAFHRFVEATGAAVERLGAKHVWTLQVAGRAA